MHSKLAIYFWQTNPKSEEEKKGVLINITIFTKKKAHFYLNKHYVTGRSFKPFLASQAMTTGTKINLQCKPRKGATS